MNLVSGATGFIGKRLFRSLCQAGQPCVGLSRSGAAGEDLRIADLADIPALTSACMHVEQVFHCAGYAHAFSSISGDDAALHWRINFEGTRNLVEAAGAAGVKRFVFLSSVKAMPDPGDLFVDEDFVGDPSTAYGLSKRAAEAAVLDAGRRYGMHVVNLRLAMVYGAGGRGNLERMARLIQRGLFPPLPETGNHRSMVHVDDVVAAMRSVAENDKADQGTFICASNEAPSGRALYDALRETLGLMPCRWSVPASALRFGGKLGDGLTLLTKRKMPLDSEVVDRLLGSAWYSPAKIERELGWRAQVSLAAGLREMLGN